jgi:hypothetical protein
MMSTAEWGLLVAVGAHATGVAVALIKLVAWGSSAHAGIVARINALEGKVDNDIAGRRIVAEMKSDVAVIKVALADLKDHVRTLDSRLIPAQDRAP